MEFMNLNAEKPAPEDISRVIARLHKRSEGTSPEGKFGFPVPNCHGKIVQPNRWDNDWSRYFTKLITAFYDADVAVNGTTPEYEGAFGALARDVIPRLLRPLQEGGRVLKPCLVHGDLWHENIGLAEDAGDGEEEGVGDDDAGDGQQQPVVVYDGSTFYGHNEYEVGTWRTVFIAFDESYRKQYMLHFPPSEPAEEWDDRNRLYSIPFNITHSAGWLGAAETTRPR